MHQDINQMVEAFSNSDAVIFTAGSAGKDVAKVDLDGAVKTMKAAEKAGIKRYIMVSAVNADHPETWPGQSLHDYYIGKHYADEWLKQTDLDYVIVQPVTLSDKPATGEISSDYAKLSDDISREDVAEFLAQVVRKQSANRLTVDISNGDEAIHEVISDL
ncbi:NAD(P)-binding oxidoreductase [Holzapfeliella floricola]|uniref:NAD(P)-binding oxidoreductase n=1 Tax=Holzapfeliella floricola TaxID=679249 RepID=UPI00078140CD